MHFKPWFDRASQKEVSVKVWLCEMLIREHSYHVAHRPDGIREFMKNSAPSLNVSDTLPGSFFLTHWGPWILDIESITLSYKDESLFQSSVSSFSPQRVYVCVWVKDGACESQLWNRLLLRTLCALIRLSVCLRVCAVRKAALFWRQESRTFESWSQRLYRLWRSELDKKVPSSLGFNWQD